MIATARQSGFNVTTCIRRPFWLAGIFQFGFSCFLYPRRLNPGAGDGLPNRQRYAAIPMHTEQELHTKIGEIVESIVMKKVTPDTQLIATGLVDSLAAVDITLAVESEYGCSIPAPEIAEHLQSVRVLAGYVAAHTS
jgi:D-alanine--poly(phosphoribitol) ligase subunit 2